ncbi:DNA-directed RNA polymerase [Phaeosphaeria sp. MPI-PUGE-AT-0046c]|nr:DNA-directed RNA polymerase [Phaeosphaeria sp. MPI-PUGE-AT-0046c]
MATLYGLVPPKSQTVEMVVARNASCGLRDNQKGHSYVSHRADHEHEDRFELFLGPDDEPKVEWKEETRVPNTAIFTFNREDHTLGNLISQRLLKYDYIVFSAYKVPHPLFATFELRVSTDGTIAPKDAIIKCCRDVIQDLEQLKQSFTTEWLGKRIVSEGEAERMARDQNNY